MRADQGRTGDVSVNAAPLQRALIELLARHPEAIRTNTPLDVLATHMVTSMQLFEASLLERSRHPFFAPARDKIAPHVTDRMQPDPGSAQCGLYRDRPRPTCESCED